ncbi:MAG: 1-deoxy-D-xylulose-5-phosphate synthase [Clostridia bacterium]|nr:1-deoxy-D-xylulose-5-phosphate synthase [Clostridia bacterium]
MGDYKILNKINSPKDIKELSTEELYVLCEEIRTELIETVSKNGGHLAPNLGTVELTVALHKVFDSPRDQIVWDVGHQSYTHKLLTGRFDRFSTIRQEGGISGFCRPKENEHDIMSSGHSSTSISSAYGLAKANSILGYTDRYSIAVIGDGALTGGLAYEGINNAGKSNDNLIIVLNDNKMSISKNVGAMSRHLSVLRSKPSYYKLKEDTEHFLNKIPLIGKRLSWFVSAIKSGLRRIFYRKTIFEDMGFIYLGPINGHDVELVSEVLESAKNRKRPVIVHVNTVKGKGYSYAEDNPRDFHGISPFDIETGDYGKGKMNYSEKFGSILCDIAKDDSRICAVTAAMTSGTGLIGFSEQFADRFFDVGIAEGHAVTFASGLSRNGLVPVVALYSTFLQRAYDQLMHDASMQDLKMVIAIDRAGFVGEDGESHHGVFDTSYLNAVPKMTVYSPSSYEELELHLKASIYDNDGLCAVRYPRGGELGLPQDYVATSEAYTVYGNENADIAIVTFGRLFGHACKALIDLKAQNIDVKIIKLNRIRPIDIGAVKAAIACKNVFFFEEGVKSGSVGSNFASMLLENNFKGDYKLSAIGDEFVGQATMASLLNKCGLDADGMIKTISSTLK